MPSLTSTRARNKTRNQDAKHPVEAASRRARKVLGDSMVKTGPGAFGAFATTDFARDFMRARWDVDFFCERFLGFTPHPGQQRMFRAYIMRDESRWMARYLDINVAAGNRAGKTLGLAVVIFHASLYKMGLKPPDPLDPRSLERWLNLSFEWYHFGVHQEVAELVFHEITRLLSGTHEAQKGVCPLREWLGDAIADWSRKYRGEYLMIVLHPLLGGGVIHVRTTGERAIGSLGKDMHGESYDECAFDPNFEFVINEVLHNRRLSTGGQLILIGTMTEGLTSFADRWADGDPSSPDRKVDSVSLRISTRENIGYGIDERIFDRLVAGMPPYLIPQNIDGFAIEAKDAFLGAEAVKAAFRKDLPEVAPSQRNHRYAHGTDPALTYDSTGDIVLDISDEDLWLGVYINRLSGRQSHMAVAGLLVNTHNAYDHPESNTVCHSGLDATGFGGKIFRDLIPIASIRMVEFGGTKQKKLLLLNEMKRVIESGRIAFPSTGKWLWLRRQLLGYKLDDRKIEQDAVMALAVAIDVAKRNAGRMTASVPFDYFAPGLDDGVGSAEAALRIRLLNATRGAGDAGGFEP